MNASESKVSADDAPLGADGQLYLAAGDRVALRMWRDEVPAESKGASTRQYETVGYVIEGTADLHVDGKTIKLRTGDSWCIPAGVEHRYDILETFSAIEATAPPARVTGA